MENLTGRLLVATPSIEDGVFHRSVVLVLHHSDEGAQGVILNRPTEAMVDEALPGWQDHATAPTALFEGGPVGLDSALGVVSVPGEDKEPLGVHRLFRGVGVVDLDAPPLLIAAEVAGLRIFVGYSGWDGGQLEEEIFEGSWYVVDAEARDPFSDDPHGMWVRVLARQRDRLALLATFPENPSLN
ncbi:YqgE/AlgH family protein [Actinomycetota bacterium]